MIEGDSNRVELQSADDAVRDLGPGNRVTRADGVPRESDSPVAAQQSTTPVDRPGEPVVPGEAITLRSDLLGWNRRS